MAIDIPTQVNAPNTAEPAAVTRTIGSFGLSAAKFQVASPNGPVGSIEVARPAQPQATDEASQAAPQGHHHHAHHRHGHHHRHHSHKHYTGTQNGHRPISRLGQHFKSLGRAVSAKLEQQTALIRLAFSEIASAFRSPLAETYITRPFTQEWIDDPGMGGKKQPHPAFDLHAPDGTPVHAPADSTVHQILRNHGAGGNQLILAKDVKLNDGSQGQVLMRFEHLSVIPNSLHVGQSVSGGEVIAKTGHTGDAAGDPTRGRLPQPHLHFSMQFVYNHKELSVPPVFLIQALNRYKPGVRPDPSQLYASARFLSGLLGSSNLRVAQANITAVRSSRPINPTMLAGF